MGHSCYASRVTRRERSADVRTGTRIPSPPVPVRAPVRAPVPVPVRPSLARPCLLEMQCSTFPAARRAVEFPGQGFGTCAPVVVSSDGDRVLVSTQSALRPACHLRIRCVAVQRPSVAVHIAGSARVTGRADNVRFMIAEDRRTFVRIMTGRPAFVTVDRAIVDIRENIARVHCEPLSAPIGACVPVLCSCPVPVQIPTIGARCARISQLRASVPGSDPGNASRAWPASEDHPLQDPGSARARLRTQAIHDRHMPTMPDQQRTRTSDPYRARTAGMPGSRACDDRASNRGIQARSA